MNKVKVAIGDDFLNAFARIPKKQQGKVMEFIGKFRENPTSPGINYEKIQRFRDPNLRSVRIDQDYRGIVLKPESGNVFVLLWVDHHDDAYAWGENKRCIIHPETGSLQMLEARTEDEPVEIKAPGSEGLFSAIRDRHLLALGVPEEQLSLVRALQTEADLDGALDELPPEAGDALTLLAAGYTVEDTFRELEKPVVPPPVDTEDYATALDNPDSQRRFHVVEDEQELLAMLNAPLEKWRVFLHPSQRRLVERDWNGPVRVLGGAGTGKTVAAMHRTRWLAQRHCGSGQKVLFTTFTRNLAADIDSNLRKLCAPSVMQHIEVINLDRWVSNFLRQQGYAYEIDYGRRSDELWRQALTLAPPELNLDPTFYREEWERIIQAQGITALPEYSKAPRTGRGVRLNRSERRLIWPVFEEYRLLLDNHGLREADDAMRDARQLLAQQSITLPYRYIIVDEAQDMGTQAFELLRQLIPEETQNDLFIAGDAHQRIYRHKVVLGRCGVNIRGRSRKLRINYRTTEQTRRWAISLLTGVEIDDLDGGQDDPKGYRSLMHGVEPRVMHFADFDDEISAIAEYLTRLRSDPDFSDVCLVARTNRLLENYSTALEEKSIPTRLIKRSQADDPNEPGLRLATMHRVKGLEFNYVIIAGANDGVVPLERAISNSSDITVARESEIHEKALLYVAATRAKKELLVTGYGKCSRFITINAE